MRHDMTCDCTDCGQRFIALVDRQEAHLRAAVREQGPMPLARALDLMRAVGPVYPLPQPDEMLPLDGDAEPF